MRSQQWNSRYQGPAMSPDVDISYSARDFSIPAPAANSSPHFVMTDGVCRRKSPS